MADLEDIRVLDCSQYGTGPYATLLLSFLGAEVIKLEAPSGDPMRALTTCYKGISFSYALLNLNKKCITLDLKKEEGREIFKKLASLVDILVENFLPETMEGWGLSYQSLSEINPRLIYASISGFGWGSKYQKTPAYDPIIQAMSGAMASTGFPGHPPVRTVAGYADFGASAHLAVAILGALYHREQSGRGQRVEIAMRDTILRFPLGIHNAYLESGRVERELGNRMVGFAPYNAYKAKDGYVFICSITDAQAREIMKAIGKEDFITNEKYKTLYDRWRNVEEIDSMVQAWTETKSKEEIYREMSQRDIPCAPVIDMEELWNDEDLLNRGKVVEVEQPGIGKVKVLGSPFGVFSSEPPKAAPLIRQHNQEIYGGLLSLSEREIEGLRQRGII